MSNAAMNHSANPAVTMEAVIEAHRAAWAAYNQALEVQDKIEEAYKREHSEPFFVQCLLGGGYDSQLTPEEMKKHVADEFTRQRAACRKLARIAPEEASRVAAILDAKEAENLALIQKAFADEEGRREEFGLSAAERASNIANEVEEDAALAVASFPCRTMEEVRAKAAYLASASRFKDCVSEEINTALINSLLTLEARP